MADALAATAAISLPSEASFVPGSLAWEGGGTAWVLADTVRWTGPLSAGSRITVTYQLTLPSGPIHPPLYSVAFLEDGIGGQWERPTWLFALPLRYYFPVMFKDGS